MAFHDLLSTAMVIGTQFAFVMGSERINGLLRPEARVLLETAKFLTEVRHAPLLLPTHHPVLTW